MKIEVVLASTNEGKVRELLELFAEPRLVLRTLKGLVPVDFEVEETGSTFEDNAWLKALEVCRAAGRPALADDSGLEVDALSGRPGVYSARFAGLGATDADNNDLLLHQLRGVAPEQRTARFRSAIALAVPGPQGPVRIGSAHGVIEGRIVTAPRGTNGFGYDCLFEPLPFLGLTTAQMAPEEKNAISHRAVAAAMLTPTLKAWLDGAQGILRFS